MKSNIIYLNKKVFLKILVFLVTVLLTGKLYAANIDTATAKTIAKNFYYEMASAKKAVNYENLQLTLADTRIESNEPIYHIYNVNKNGGWVIVSAENSVIPVLAFSTEGSYGFTNQPPAFIDWMNNYKTQILYAKQNNIDVDSNTKNIWSKYSFKPSISKNVQSVGPLLSSTWDQSYPYNYYCPYLSNPGQSITGCVATAMGQILKYWGKDMGYKLPQSGVGSHGYTDDTYGYQYVDFCNTQYDWVNMQNSISASSSQVQIDAVSKLLYHCGVSVDMDYNTSANRGSSAWPTGSSVVANAFTNFFGFASTAVDILKSNYTDSNWKNIITDELNNNRPIMYGGSGTGGHAFVCDGYLDIDYYHFNWGWSGSYNGYYYSLTSLTPNTTMNFSDMQEAVIGIQPGAYMSMYNDFVLSPNPIEQGQPLDISVSLANYGFEDFNGDLTIGLFDFNTGALVETIEQKNNVSQSTQTFSTYNFHTNSISSAPGNYFLALLYNKNATTCWIIAPKSTYSNPLEITIISQPLTSDFTSNTTAICAGSTVYFTDLSSGKPTSWQWNFGDGYTSTAQNPSHIYNTAGNYTVSLSVSNGNSSDSYSVTNYISVYALPSTAATPTGTTTLCQDTPNNSYSTSGATNATAYIWNISPTNAGTISGIGTTAIVDWNASYTGIASITVRGTNNCGNGAYSGALSVTVNPTPTANAGTDKNITSGSPATLTASGGTSYSWSNGANTQSITVYPTNTTTYTVTVYNSYGCSSTDDIVVYVSGGALLSNASATPFSICSGSTVQLNANPSGGNGIYTYSWSSNPIGFSSTLQNPVASPTHTTTYTVTVTSGVNTATSSAIVTVNDGNVVDIGQTYPGSLANGLIAYYPFNGNANDASGSGNNGTVHGATLATDRFGNANSAYSFNSSNKNYIELNNLVGKFGASDFSISTWFNSTAPSGMLMSKRNTEGCDNFWEFYTNKFSISQDASCTGSTITAANTPSVNDWHHSVIQKTSNKFRLYIDGVLTDSLNTTTSFDVTNNNACEIGAQVAPISGVVGCFNGKIDDIRIYTRALSTNEAETLFIEGKQLSISAQQSDVCFGESLDIYLLNSQPGIQYQLQANNTTVGATQIGNGDTLVFNTGALTSSQTFTILATNITAGCAKILNASVPITVNQITANAGSDVSICTGENITLIATGGTVYNWSSGVQQGVPFMPVMSATYTVTVTSTNNCSATDNVTVTVNSIPSTPVIYQTGSTLNSTASIGNQWYMNGTLIIGATSQTYTPTADGKYFVIVTANGCVSDTSNVLSVTVTNTLELQSALGAITVYPNPNNGNITLEYKSDIASALKVKIQNTLGEIVFTDIIPNSSGLIKKSYDLSHLNAGIFYLIAENENTTEVKRIIIQK